MTELAAVSGKAEMEVRRTGQNNHFTRRRAYPASQKVLMKNFSNGGGELGILEKKTRPF